MTEDKLTNGEIARVFAMYVPCKGKLLIPNFYPEPCDIVGINFDDHQLLIVEGSGFQERDCMVNHVKLLLTDLKDITDEHANDVVKVLRIDEKEAGYDTNGAAIKNCLAKDGFYALSLFDFYGTGADTYQYLISKGYTVPIWFGIDHWANGKTAIELGIAISK